MNQEKGILPKVYGGLGNQMFILAASHVISKRLGCPLYIPKNPKNHMNAHNTGIDYYESIFKYIGIHLESPEWELLQTYPFTQYVSWHRDGFQSWDVKEFFPGMILDSYFQYYPSLQPFEAELRKLFSLPQLIVPENTAFIHIRRGDYLKNPSFHFIQPLSYYEKGISVLEEKGSVDHIYVFSDDPNWVKEQSLFQTPFYTIIENQNEIECLALMAGCKAGGICANSTFSWWGAFLGAHEKRNPVIVPKNWINCPVVSLFPDEWIIV